MRGSVRSCRSCSTVGRIIRLTFALLLALVPACEQNPGEYDYHGGKPDAPRPDIPGTTDFYSGSEVQDVSQVNVSELIGAEVVDEQGGNDASDELSEDVGWDLVPLPGIRKCFVEFSFAPPDGSAVFLAGSMTDWTKGEIPLEDADSDGTWETQVDISVFEPGSYAYKFHTAADNWYMDPSNPMSIWDGGIQNSKLIVPDCSVPEVVLESLEVGKGSIRVVAMVRNPKGSAGVIPASAKLRVNGKQQPTSFFNPGTGTFDVSLSGLENKGRVVVELSIANENGESDPLIVPAWVDGKDWSWQDAVIYFVLTDRFLNGRKDNDCPSTCTDKNSPTNWHGGDFAGIVEKLKEGYFESLGVNVLWISPVVNNPSGCYTGQVQGISYTSYHGYFPIEIEATEEHFGSMEELKALVDSAHSRGLRVIMDFVANHVHEESELFKQNKDQGWFHPFYPCEPNWDKPIECWFQPYLPDLDYTNDDVVETFTNNALFWIRETGVDGFRVDAVKHMVHNFVRTLRWKIENRLWTQVAPFYMVGETFVGEWGGGSGSAETLIKEYVNPWELDGQFDFPLYWQVLRAVGRDEGSFTELAAFLEESQGYYGKKALMVNFIGNHDVPRFLSHAAGQIADQWGNGSKLQGFTAPPALPSDSEPFKRLRLALGLILTLPGIPMIYYGDEVGLPGAGDPDNRRDMVFEGLSSNQSSVLDFTRLMGKLRRELAPLRRGSFSVVSSTDESLVFLRNYSGETVLVAANRSPMAVKIDVASIDFPSAKLIDRVSGIEVQAKGGKAQLPVEPFGLAVFVADGGN